MKNKRQYPKGGLQNKIAKSVDRGVFDKKIPKFSALRAKVAYKLCGLLNFSLIFIGG